MTDYSAATRGRTAAGLTPCRDIDQLRARLRGQVVLPTDAHYDAVRQLWNGMVDRRPAFILRCATTEDVAEAVTFARGTGLPVAVRGGGHSIAGNSSCDGGVMIDLSPMRTIRVDATTRTAVAGPGVLLSELDAATQAHGLAVPSGVVGHTGIAGLTLGGGIGRLARKHGLTCDNLLSAEVVLADGRVVRASAVERPDLFWGLRGGGGNLGIVTAFEYRLHPLGPTVLGGLLLHDFARARQALRFYRDFNRAAPDEVSADAVLLATPEGPMLGISCCYLGPVEEGERVLRPLREFGPPAQDLVGPVAYTALQTGLDDLFARGRRFYWKSHYLHGISDAAVEAMLARFAEVPGPPTLVVLQQVGGAISRVDPATTAYGNRDAAYDCVPIAIWDDPTEDERNIAWTRGFAEAVRPFATGGVYVNNLGEEGEERVRAAYGSNYVRLARLKAEYDPTNLFRLNQNVRPAA
ncbi:FAD-binding oxidoreductase [Belnapia sp. T6]|uniref:FAD-binding oxidoreductase n=1 Tax=Belnapia mucosa TaxID=2804532 RepID=A0ABS1VBR6_9PROT|nr:FAD-binding oxidoreductase [Belnapia mucosa]MBL6458767.1 FAD-binding oxidoreductase [Belnapia mucosa]